MCPSVLLSLWGPQGKQACRAGVTSQAFRNRRTWENPTQEAGSQITLQSIRMLFSSKYKATAAGTSFGKEWYLLSV